MFKKLFVFVVLICLFLTGCTGCSSVPDEPEEISVGSDDGSHVMSNTDSTDMVVIEEDTSSIPEETTAESPTTQPTPLTDEINEEFNPKMIPGELVPLEGVDQTIFSGHKWPWLRYEEIIPPELPAEAKLIKPIISMDWFAENHPEDYEKIKNLIYSNGDVYLIAEVGVSSAVCVMMPEGLGGIGDLLIIEFDDGTELPVVNIGKKPSNDDAQTYEIDYAPDGTMLVSQISVVSDLDYGPDEIKSGDASYNSRFGFGAISKVIVCVPAKIVEIEKSTNTSD